MTRDNTHVHPPNRSHSPNFYTETESARNLSESRSRAASTAATDQQMTPDEPVPVPRPFARPPKTPAHLPDPSQFPDPYPYRQTSSNRSGGTPALSFASSSTRSSAYTSIGSALVSGEYSHIHVASGDPDDEIGVAVGITSDEVANFKERASKHAATTHFRAPIDQTRWSDYSTSLRSRSSSGPNASQTTHDSGPPRLSQKPSYDTDWRPAEEREEIGLTSDDETEDDHGLEEYEEPHLEAIAEERTAAIVIAEEGRGLIVHGEGLPISQLQVETGKSKDSTRTDELKYSRYYTSIGWLIHDSQRNPYISNSYASPNFLHVTRS